MKRRLVIAASVLVVAGIGSGIAANAGTPTVPTHNICVLMSGDPDHQNAQYLCVGWPGSNR